MNLSFIINHVKIEIKIVNLFVVQTLFDNKIYLKIKKKNQLAMQEKFKQDQETFLFFLKLSRV